MCFLAVDSAPAGRELARKVLAVDIPVVPVLGTDDLRIDEGLELAWKIKPDAKDDYQAEAYGQHPQRRSQAVALGQ